MSGPFDVPGQRRNLFDPDITAALEARHQARRDRISGQITQREQQWQERYEALKMPLTDAEFEFIAEGIKTGEIKENEVQRIAAASVLSRKYQIPISEIIANLDEYVRAEGINTDPETKPQTLLRAVGNNVLIGINTVRLGKLQKQFAEADYLNPDPEYAKALSDEIAFLEEDSRKLQDAVPKERKFLAQKAYDIFTAAAQTTPYMAYMGFHQKLGALTGIPLGISEITGPLAGFTAGWDVEAGHEYWALRSLKDAEGNPLIDKDVAWNTANLTGAASSAIEQFLFGSIAKLGKAVVGKEVVSKAAKFIAGNVFKRLQNNASLYKAATYMTEYLLDIPQEMGEEGLQSLASAAGEAVAIELQNARLEEAITGLPPEEQEAVRALRKIQRRPLGEIADDAAQEMKAAFNAQILLGAVPLALGAKTTARDARTARTVALASGSEAEHRAVSADLGLYKDMDPEMKQAAQDKVFAATAAARERSQISTEELKNAAEIKATAGLDEGYAEPGVNKETGETIPLGAPYKKNNGRWYAKLDEENGLFKIGDARNETEENLYAHIAYHKDADGRIEVEEFVVRRDLDTPENRQAMWSQFSEEFAGEEIVWTPSLETEINIREDLKNHNPQGEQAGLNYFAETEADRMEEARFHNRVIETLQKYFPKQSNAEHAVMAAEWEFFSDRQGLSLEEYVDKEFGGLEKAFAAAPPTDFIAGRAAAASKEGKVVKGAVTFGDWTDKGFAASMARDAKAIIYVTEHADLSTFIHEMGHIYRRRLQGDMLAEAERLWGVTGGKWLRAQEERFTEDLERWRREGKAPSPEMESFFQKFAEFLKKVFNAVSKRAEVSPEIAEFFNRLYAGDEYSVDQKMNILSPEINAKTGQEGRQSARTGKDTAVGTEAAQQAGKEQYEVNKKLNEERPSLDKNNKSGDAKPKQSSNDLDEIYRLVKESRGEFNIYVEELQKKYGGKIVSRKQLKAKDRAKRKITPDEGAESILDINGKTLVLDDLESIIAVMQDLHGRDEVVRMKDRYKKPEKSHYRDTLTNIRMSNGAIVELQLNTKQMLAAKEELGGHLLYEIYDQVTVAYEKGIISEADYKKLIGFTNKGMETLYDAAFEAALTGAMTSASSLDIGELLKPISTHFHESGTGSKVLSEKTLNNLLTLQASGLSSHSRNSNSGSSNAGTSVTSVPSTTSIGPTDNSVNSNREQNIRNGIDYTGTEETKRKFEEAPGLVGSSGKVRLGGKKIKGHYELKPSGAATPSHNPLDGFKQNSGFWKHHSDGSSVNRRNYEGDADAQAATLKMASDYNGKALGGIVVYEGKTVSGNGREQAGQIAARQNTDAEYLEDLKDDAGKYGFDSEAVERFIKETDPHPRLYFVVDEELEINDQLFAEFNLSSRKAQSPLETAVNISKQITPETVDSIAGVIGGFETVEELYKDKKALLDIFNTLGAARLIGEFDMPQYFTEKSGITGAGEELLENTLLGAVLEESNIRALAESRGIRRKLVRALPQLTENRAMAEYSVIPEVNEAVRIAAEVDRNRKTWKTVEEWAAQQGFDFTEQHGQVAIELARRLEEKEQSGFADMMGGLNAVLREEAKGQSDMFGSSSKDDILRRYLGVKAEIDRVREANNKVIADTTASAPGRINAALDNAGLAKAEAGGTLYQIDAGEDPVSSLKANARNIADPTERERVTAEIDELAKLYPPESNKYLAPNGKPSSLNHAQWYAVRTPSFKEWFGDWETRANAEWVFTAGPVSVLSGEEFKKSETDLIAQVDGFFKSIGGTVEREGLGVVELTRQGIRSSIAHGIGREKAAAFKAVPDIIKNGKIIDRQTNWKGRGYDTYVIDAPIKIESTDYIVEVIIEQNTTKKNEYYLHEVEIKEKAQSAFKTATERSAPQASRLIIARKLSDVKADSVSKVVDENGEPLEMFHAGTFDEQSDIPREGMHFGTIAAAMERWDDMEISIASTKKAGNPNAGKKPLRLNAVFLNLRNPALTPDQNTGLLWERVIKEAKDLGVDGLEYTNEVEDAGSTSYVAFSPEQIKSATGNAGTYSTDNPLILFQLDAELVEEASEFATWQAFRDSIETGEVSEADNAWYQSLWKDARIIHDITDTLFQEEGGEKQTWAQTLDKSWADEADRKYLTGALKELHRVRNGVFLEPAEGEDRTEYDRVQRLRNRIEYELPNTGSLIGIAAQVNSGGQLSSTQYTRVKRWIQKDTRAYRSVFADLMGQAEYLEDLAGIEDGEPAARLANPRPDRVNITERLREIGREIGDPALEARIASGEATMDDPQIVAFEKGREAEYEKAKAKLEELEKEIKEDFARLSNDAKRRMVQLYEALLAAKEKKAGLSEKIQRMIDEGISVSGDYQKQAHIQQANYDRAYKAYDDFARTYGIEADVREAIARRDARYAERERLAKLERKRRAVRAEKEIKQTLLKRVMRKVSDAINYDQAAVIKTIQRLMLPEIGTWANRWIGSIDGPILQAVWSQYYTDEEYREKLIDAVRNEKAKNSESRVSKIEKLLGKPWEDIKPAEKKDLARLLPKADFVRENAVVRLLKENKESIQLDIEEKIDTSTGRVEYILSDALTQKMKDTVGEDVLRRMLHKPLPEWTVAEFEELAKAVDRLAVEGRRERAAQLEAKKRTEAKYREEVLKAIRTGGIEIDDDDTPEEKERKTKQLAKLATKLERYADGRKKNRLWNNFFDANLRRFTTAMDGGRTGPVTNLLYWGENDAYNAEQRAIAARRLLVEKVMKDNGIEVDELYKPVEIPGLDDSALFKKSSGKLDAVSKDLGLPAAPWSMDSYFENNPKPSLKGADIFRVSGGVITIDDLLYIMRGVKNEETRKAIVYGSLSNASERAYFKGRIESLQGAGDLGMLEAEAFRNIGYYRLMQILSFADEFFAKEENKKFLELANAIGEDYDHNGERLNKFCIEIFNQPMWRVTNYVPMNRREQTGGENENRIIEDLLGVTGAGQKWVERGFTKKREYIAPYHQAPIELGLYNTWAKSVTDNEHLIAYGPLVQTLNAVFKGYDSKIVQQKIQDRWGAAANKRIFDTIAEFANPNPTRQRSDLDALIRGLRGKTATAYLAWKTSSILKQIVTSPWPYLQEIPPPQYIRAALEVAGGFNKVVNNFIREKSIFMKNRQFDPMIKLIKDAMDKHDNGILHGIDKFNTLGMQGLEGVDWACVAPGWLAKYRMELVNIEKEQDAEYQKLLKKYHESQYADVLPTEESKETRALSEIMTSEQQDALAVARADDAVRRMQPSSRAADLAAMFKNRNEITMAVLQFQAALNVIWQNIRYDLPLAVKEKQIGTIAGMVTGYALAGIGLGLLLDDDDEDEKEERNLARWILFNSLTQFTDAVPVFGEGVTKLSETVITGKASYQGQQNLWPVVQKAFSGAASAAGALREEDPDKRAAKTARAVKSTMEAFGIAFGLPVSGVNELGRAAGIGDGDGELGFYPEAFMGRRNK